MIRKIDHMVITAENIFSTAEFYEKLGFIPKYRGERCELYAGDFKINVHVLGKELSPHAKNVQTGSGDFCFEINGDMKSFEKRLSKKVCRLRKVSWKDMEFVAL